MSQSSSLTLTSIGSAGFRDYREYLVENYAREKVEAGQWASSGALARAEDEVAALLPDGPRSRGHYLYEIEVDPDTCIGRVWLQVSVGRESAWIYDIVISEEFRGKGYGSLALAAVEARARELGARELGLHVFAHNVAARSLYEKSGYAETSISMSKTL